MTGQESTTPSTSSTAGPATAYVSATLPTGAPVAPVPAARPRIPSGREPPKPSSKEMKEQKKREKAERRQQAKNDSASTPQRPQKPQQQKKESQNKGKGGRGAPGGLGQESGIVKTIYSHQPSPKPSSTKDQDTKREVKDKDLVGLLKDLENEQNEKKKKVVFGLCNAHPDVHPAILTLGVQMNQFTLVGSTARCLGFMLGMKRLIQDYECPRGATLSRHLPGHYFSRQIEYLISARPMSIALGNSIRWLKTEIAGVSPDLSEEAAKKLLVGKIEIFIHERITGASQAIVNTTAGRYINEGDTILTFAKSQVVERSLLESHSRGKRFNVIVVDNTPLNEGKNAFSTLISAGIEAQYVQLAHINVCMRGVTRVLLGAHALQVNGALHSRVGTAIVAQAAHDSGVPVVACCESIKFSEKFSLGGIVGNELGDPEMVAHMDGDEKEAGSLAGWRDQPNTHIYTFLYDTTPAEFIKLVVSEHGALGPKACLNVLRASGSSAPLR